MITLYSEEQLFELAIAYLQVAYPKASVGTRAYLGHQARSLAQLVGVLQQGVREADANGVPAYQVDYDGVLRSRCSKEALDDWAFTFGVPSNRGPGVYGRNAAQNARGGAGTASGAPGTVIPAGYTLADENTGAVIVSLVSTVTLDAGGAGSCSFVAVTTGAAGNLPVGAKLRWQTPPGGLSPLVTLTTALVGGYEEESDLELLARIIGRLQNPPRGGTAHDWRDWSETAKDTAGRLVGIRRAYVYKVRNGAGSVDIVITQDGNGTGRDPGATKQGLIAAALDKLRIATDSYRVIRPSFAPAFRLLVKVVATYGNGYDWDDGGSPMTIVSVSGLQIVISGANAPANLVAAINAGSYPRIQVAGLSVGPLPQMRRVYASAPNTPMAGQTTLSLTEAFEVAPAAGEVLYAGGGCVETVASAVLAYINGVGPSRQSGYADPLDSWEDVVSVSRVAQSAIDSRDAYGQPVISYDPRVGEGVGVVFTVGAVSDSKDKRLWDNMPGTVGPQLPVCSGILVTKG